jgi:hypothetical protein
MISVVIWSAIAAAGICMAVGIWSAVSVLPRQRDVLAAVTPSKPQSDEGLPAPITNQSLSAAVESVAKLASALKDIDRVAQMFTLALGFLSVAAVAAGVDAIAGVVK